MNWQSSNYNLGCATDFSFKFLIEINLERSPFESHILEISAEKKYRKLWPKRCIASCEKENNCPHLSSDPENKLKVKRRCPQLPVFSR